MSPVTRDFFDPIGTGVAIGVVSGTVKGMWQRWRWLPPNAVAYLDGGKFDASTLEREGLRWGLLQTGHLKRSWLFWFKRTSLPVESPSTPDTLGEREP